jgi:type 1 glutamine amidotransferase
MLRSPQYDTVAPLIPDLQHPAVLVLSKTNGFIHKEGLPAAGAMLAELATSNGWHIYQTDNAATHNARDLERFDVVVWNNTSGDILTPSQRADFKAWLTAGGQWLGLHAAGGDPSYDWDWYVDTLLGAQFFGHTMSPQFQDAEVLVENAAQPLTANLPSPWRIEKEEWYAFDRNPRDTGATILLTLDESSYDTEETFFPNPSMPGSHPIAWTRTIGQGTVIYSAIGHTAHTYSLAEYRGFVTNAINQLAEATP